MATGYDSDDYGFLERVDDYKCPICHCVTKEPTLTSCCGNHYCQVCIDRVLHERNPCPWCRAVKFKVFLDKKQKRKVLSLKVNCTLSGQGCEWTGSLSDLTTHTNDIYGDCGYVRIDCSRCRERIQRRKLKRHKEEECPKRSWKCSFCRHETTHDNHLDHSSTCSKFPICCPNSCEQQKIERGQLDDHLEKCPLQKICCKFRRQGCTARLVRKDMQKHMDENVQDHLLLSNRHLTNEITLLKERVDAIEAVSLVVPITFMIRQCEDNLRSADFRILHQQTFLTHPQGYRLRLYCLIRERTVYFSLKFKDSCSPTNLPLPQDLSLTVTIKNQLWDSDHLRLQGEFELKSNDEVVKRRLPSIETDRLLYPNSPGIVYILNDTLL